MILMVISIYLIILCWYSFSKIRINASLIVKTNGQVLIQLVIILTILIFFVLGLRVLNLFRQYKSINLYSIFNDHNILYIILYIILLYSFRKLIIYLFKLSWFKLHYVFMCQNNFSFYETYRRIFFKFIYSPAFFIFKYLFYINYLLIIVLILILFHDLFFNHLILNYSLWYLKYYSVFRLVYMCYHFLIVKQNILLDYYTYNILYPGRAENNFFLNFSDVEHKMLMEESTKYNLGVILEKVKYIPKDFGNTREMAFFKVLNQNESHILR